MSKVNLPYGIDNFAKVRNRDCYYIDKTGFIKELVSETFDVSLITRPRRFGKTLTMSMLAEYFDICKDGRKLFEGLEITKDSEVCTKWMNHWPVLFITLKDVNGRRFDGAYGLLKQTIAKLCIAHSKEDNLWSILYLTGYLTRVLPEKLPKGMKLLEGNTALRIPNEEVKSVFGDTVKRWFEDEIAATDRSDLFRAWWNGEAEQLTKKVTDILFKTISYYDYREDYYHAFVVGMFVGSGYSVKSNSEQGTGRADVIVTDRAHRSAIVIEVKWPGKEGYSLESACNDALKQIEEKPYMRNLQLEGYTTICCYGAAFLGKTCLIKLL